MTQALLTLAPGLLDHIDAYWRAANYPLAHEADALVVLDVQSDFMRALYDQAVATAAVDDPP